MPNDTSQITSWLWCRFFVAGLAIVWPVLSVLLLLKAVLGAIVGWLEGWGIGQGIYFAFVTGLTIGYGDLAPREALTRVLAVVIGFLGITLTGLVAAVAVKAFQVTPRTSTR
jgi:ion channel